MVQRALATVLSLALFGCSANHLASNRTALAQIGTPRASQKLNMSILPSTTVLEPQPGEAYSSSVTNRKKHRLAYLVQNTQTLAWKLRIRNADDLKIIKEISLPAKRYNLGSVFSVDGDDPVLAASEVDENGSGVREDLYNYDGTASWNVPRIPLVLVDERTENSDLNEIYIPTREPAPIMNVFDEQTMTIKSKWNFPSSSDWKLVGYTNKTIQFKSNDNTTFEQLDIRTGQILHLVHSDLIENENYFFANSDQVVLKSLKRKSGTYMKTIDIATGAELQSMPAPADFDEAKFQEITTLSTVPEVMGYGFTGHLGSYMIYDVLRGVLLTDNYNSSYEVYYIPGKLSCTRQACTDLTVNAEVFHGAVSLVGDHYISARKEDTANQQDIITIVDVSQGFKPIYTASFPGLGFTSVDYADSHKAVIRRFKGDMTVVNY